MKQNKLISFIGIYLILSQAFIISYVLYRLKDLFVSDQAFELISLITPLFCVHLVAIIKNFLLIPNNQDETNVTLNYFFVSTFFPFFFVISLFVSIKLYENQTLEKFSDLKKIIGVIETTFGIYLGMVVDKIFPNTNSEALYRKE